jgi:hypothetical protein
MSAGTQNLIIDQSADWYCNFVYYSDTAQTIPVNLTGYTAKMQMRSNASDSKAVLTLQTGSGITITGATGTIALHATAAQTSAIVAGYYVYDLEITSGAGIVTRLIQGQIQVSPAVTR